MEIFLIVCLIAVLLIRWIQLKGQLDSLKERLNILANLLEGQDRAIAELRALVGRHQKSAPPVPPQAPAEELSKVPPISTPEPVLAEALSESPAIDQPSIEPAKAEPPRQYTVPEFAAAASPRHSTVEWETRLGGSWLNKLGVFILVVGIALALGYSFTRVGPWGRVVTSLAVSLALLLGGAAWERREQYQMFARGLMGGGWAALYITVYAMHAVEAARVVTDPIAGFFLLLAVAVGMVFHSLRYHSQTVTGVAYVVAFGSLAISEVGAFPLLTLIPLAASVLFVAHRFSWPRIVLLGLMATYGITALRAQSGTPLWQAEAIFAVYWLMFEIFDILHPGSWLLPLNAAGFLGLSLMKWRTDAPSTVWILLAASAVAYLISAVARIRSREWHGAATLAAALTAAALFQKLDHQWVASALVVEAELFYLAGVKLGVRYLRWLGAALFGVELARLLVVDLSTLPSAAWVPVASLDAVVFYANRAIVAADQFYSFAGAGMLALVAGEEVTEKYRSVAWLVLAGGAFSLGWWRRLYDFRLQAYLLGVLGWTAALLEPSEPPLAVAAAASYAALICALKTASGRLFEEEGRLLRVVGSIAATAALTVLVWRMAAGQYLGLGWMLLAVVLLELGLRGLPEDFRGLAYAVAGVGVLRFWLYNLPEVENYGPWIPRLLPAGAALLMYAMAARDRNRTPPLLLLVASSLGTLFLLDAWWAVLPADAVAPAWAASALVFLFAGNIWEIPPLLWLSYAVAALSFGRWWFVTFISPDIPLNIAGSFSAGAFVVACYYTAMLLRKDGSPERLYFSALGSVLAFLLLYHHISGSMLTVVWGVQGVALLAAGFPLRDRTLRLSGLLLLLVCIGKLFVWDLRHLETLPRIFSFIVLGLLLLGVSWIYTRYRERLSRYL